MKLKLSKNSNVRICIEHYIMKIGINGVVMRFILKLNFLLKLKGVLM